MNYKIKIIMRIQFVLLSLISFSAFGQWQQSIGTAGLNMQSLLTNGIYNFAGGAKGAYLSTDSAANYIASNVGNDSIGPTRGFAKNSSYIFTCTSKGVFRSADNGATWVLKSLGLTNLLTSGIISVGPKLFVVGPTGVFKSLDNGDNWSAAGLSTTDVRCITAIQDTLFVGTNGAGIYKSIDFGVNWITVNNGLGTAVNFRAIQTKENSLFAGGPIGSGVFRSTDFGANWTLLAGGLSTGSYRGFASNDKLIVAGAFGAGVFYSIDNGEKWTAINNGLTDLTIFDLELNDAYLIAATNTQGVFRYALSNLFGNTNVNEFSNKYKIEIFPNPATNQINVKLNIELIGTDFSIFDNNGKSVFTGKIISDNTTIELSNFKKGIYFFSVGENLKNSIEIIKE